MVVDGCLSIFGDDTIDEPDFVIVNTRVSFFDGDLVVADAFDFAAGELNPAVDFVEHIVFVPRAAVGADDRAVLAVFFFLLSLFVFVVCHSGMIERARQKFTG